MRIKQTSLNNRNIYQVVKITSIDKKERTVECICTNGLKIKISYPRGGADLHVGQYIGVVYRTKGYVEGYTLVDTLMETVDMRVIDVQRMVHKDVMYVSIVFEDRHNQSRRMFSCVRSGSSNFPNASVLVIGDYVKVRVNNGKLFDIVELGVSKV